MKAVDLTALIGKPGGPKDLEAARRQGRHEADWKEYDHLGAREGDDRPRADVKSDCFCQYCRFYRGEGGVRTIMCAQDWDALSLQARSDIAESCSD